MMSCMMSQSTKRILPDLVLVGFFLAGTLLAVQGLLMINTPEVSPPVPPPPAATSQAPPGRLAP
jgi:hypothetical protein